MNIFDENFRSKTVKPFLRYFHRISVICAAHARFSLTSLRICNGMELKQSKIGVALSGIHGLFFSYPGQGFLTVRESLTIMSIDNFQLFASFNREYFT